MSGFDSQNFAKRTLASLIEDDLVPDHAWFIDLLENQVRIAQEIEPELTPSDPVVSTRLSQILEELRAHINSEEFVVFPLVLSGRGAEARESVRGLEDEHMDIAEQWAATRKLVEACSSDSRWQNLARSMDEFESRMQRHTEIEYSVLFPRMLCGDDQTAGG